LRVESGSQPAATRAAIAGQIARSVSSKIAPRSKR
jgi:hypothetical protein